MKSQALQLTAVHSELGKVWLPPGRQVLGEEAGRLLRPHLLASHQLHHRRRYQACCKPVLRTASIWEAHASISGAGSGLLFEVRGESPPEESLVVSRCATSASRSTDQAAAHEAGAAASALSCVFDVCA